MNANEIAEEINRLEQEETTYNNCMKLAVLYTILDHDKPEHSYSGSEFLLAVSNAPIDGVLEILDNHMDCIKLLYPKEYTSILKKIKDL